MTIDAMIGKDTFEPTACISLPFFSGWRKCAVISDEARRALNVKYAYTTSADDTNFYDVYEDRINGYLYAVCDE